MKLIVVVVAAALLLTGCTGFDPNQLSIALGEALRPTLLQIKGLEPAQVEAIVKAVQDSVVGSLSVAGFDVGNALWAVGSAVAAYFGVNIRRDAQRKKRGEPTGKTPAKDR